MPRAEPPRNATSLTSRISKNPWTELLSTVPCPTAPEISCRRRATRQSPAELELLEKDYPRKVACAALVKTRTAINNNWLAERLAMGHPSDLRPLVQQIRQDKKEQKILKKYDSIWRI